MVGLSVSLSDGVTFVSPAKTAEPSEMPLGEGGGGKESIIRWGQVQTNSFAVATVT